MICWYCQKELPLSEKLPFKASCDYCHRYQHACINCRFHEVSRHNQCQISTSDFVSDREHFNFCEDFGPRKSSENKKIDLLSEAEEKLFGSSEESQKKNKFDDLFS